MVNMRWRSAAWLLVVFLAMVAGLQGGPPGTYGARDPSDCTVAEVALSMTRSKVSALLGENVTFSARLNNTGPGNCSLTQMDIAIITPDGTSHVVATNLDVPAGTTTPWYQVPYTIVPAQVVNKQVTATATATGRSRSNPGDTTDPASGSAQISIAVQPALGQLTLCTEGAPTGGSPQIRIRGSATNAPAGATVTVSTDLGQATGIVQADGTWEATITGTLAPGVYPVTAVLSYGTGNTASNNARVQVQNLTITGGSGSSHNVRPVISGTYDGGAATITVEIGGQTATVDADPTGAWSLTWPSDLTYGAHTVTASLTPPTDICASDTQTLTIFNTPPATTPDSYGMEEDGVLTEAAGFGVLANDSDPDGDPLTAMLVTGPANGTLALNPDGSFTYTPNANFNGNDGFVYKASDGVASSYDTIVTIGVRPTNDAPSAQDDAYTTSEETPLTVAAPGVLANDSDIDGDALTAVLQSGPSHGTLTLNADGSFTYTPEANFVGTDSFAYKASDGTAQSGVATVQIRVTPANDSPEASPDEYNTDEDTPLTVAAPGLLGNDTDPDGDALTAKLAIAPANGTVTINPDGSFTYTPNPNFNGLDFFEYIANDGTADSGPTPVSITVNPIDDLPVAANDAYTTAEDTALTVPAPGVLANDADVDGDPLMAELVSNPSNGTVALDSDGAFVYTPNPNFTGTDTFTYRPATGAAPATVTITVTPGNDAPTAANDAYTTQANTTLNVPVRGVLTNDTDIDAGAVLSASLVTGPANGTVILREDGSFTYVPAGGFVGTDTFTYVATDGTADSNVATVTITVTLPPIDPPPPPLNLPPFANHDTYGAEEDAVLTIPPRGVLANDTDPEGNFLTALLFSGPANGTVTMNPDGSFVYTPAPLFHGTDSFRYRVSDGTHLSNVAIVTITVRHINHAPTAADDAYTVNQGATLTVPAAGVLTNDADVDAGSVLTATLVTGPAHGTVALSANGSFVYTPDPAFHGDDSFTYQAGDGTAKSDTATARITVRPSQPPQGAKPAIQGVIIDAGTGQVIAGATVAVSADFDANGTIDFAASMVTGADGRYKIEVPRGGWTYVANVTAPVNTAVGTVTVSTTHTTVVPDSDKGGAYNAERKIAGQVLLSLRPGAQAQRPDEIFTASTSLEAMLFSGNMNIAGKPVMVHQNGLFEVSDVAAGEHRLVLQVKAPDSKSLAAYRLPVSVTGDGELVVGLVLVAPGGKVADAVTKQPVDGAKVTLYWADTDLNRSLGRTPDTPVSLPALPDGMPGSNAVPQLTAAGGTYAWLVHPNGDYYLIAEKPGYRSYDSRKAGILHVDDGVLNHSFEMEPVHRRFIIGYPDGTFKPEQSITRAEIAAILARIIQPTPVDLPAPPFADVAPGHWAATYIELVRQHGLMIGDPNGNFRPDAPITRAELATIIVRFNALKLDAPNPFTDTVGHWAEAAISAAYRTNLVTGYPDGTFNPQANTSRAEAATMINRMLGRGPLSGRSAPTWPDVPFSHWASGHVEEASSSHSSVKGDPAGEHWTSDTGESTW